MPPPPPDPADSPWHGLIRGYQAWCAAEGHRPQSVRTRLSYLRRFAADHPGGPEVGGPQLAAWVAKWGWGPATLKSGQGALRSFYTYAVKAGHVQADPCAALGRVKVPQRLPRPASDEVARAAAHVSDPDRRLMVGLALRMGLRRTEIAQVQREDVCGSDLLVHGKGGKDRLVPLHPDLASALRLKPAGYVFPGRFGGHLHPQTVADWIREETGSSPHPLRHRFATKAYRGTKDIFGVQKVLGHASPETTMVYTKVTTDDLAGVMAAAWAD